MCTTAACHTDCKLYGYSSGRTTGLLPSADIKSLLGREGLHDYDRRHHGQRAIARPRAYPMPNDGCLNGTQALSDHTQAQLRVAVLYLVCLAIAASYPTAEANRLESGPI